MDKGEVDRRLNAGDVANKLKGIRINREQLIQLLASPLSSPHNDAHQLYPNLQRLKVGKKNLRAQLRKTANQIERLILPLPKPLQTLFAMDAIDTNQLVADMRTLDKALASHPDSPKAATRIHEVLSSVSNPTKGRPSRTSPRDHRTWQLASLLKASTGKRHYSLVAYIMEWVYGDDLNVESVKRIISRHPNENTYFPEGWGSQIPGKIVTRSIRRTSVRSKILYSPPVPINPAPPDSPTKPSTTSKKSRKP